MKTIGFIGAGKVGTSLGCYFKHKGFEIAGYYSHTADHAADAARRTDSVAFTNQLELIEKSDMIWITTPDDTIEICAEEIAAEITSLPIDKIFLHASGVHSCFILQSLAEKGFEVASAHPLLAFNDVEQAVVDLEKTYFALEGNDQIITTLTRFFQQTGNQTFVINAKEKPLYHAAASMLSNYLVTLFDTSCQMFGKAGMPEAITSSAAMPLLESVVGNLKRTDARNALTGPIKRGDRNTISLHLQSIEKEMPEIVDLYQTLGRQTMKMLNDFRLNELLESESNE
jgi:predicted short-subunit dehydrogenase-like oxidoreductase (DUF2520 family)